MQGYRTPWPLHSARSQLWRSLTQLQRYRAHSYLRTQYFYTPHQRNQRWQKRADKEVPARGVDKAQKRPHAGRRTLGIPSPALRFASSIASTPPCCQKKKINNNNNIIKKYYTVSIINYNNLNTVWCVVIIDYNIKFATTTLHDERRRRGEN